MKPTKLKVICLLFLFGLFTGSMWQLEIADNWIINSWAEGEYGKPFNWIFTWWSMDAWAARDLFMLLMFLCFFGFAVICLSFPDSRPCTKVYTYAYKMNKNRYIETPEERMLRRCVRNPNPKAKT